MTITPTTPARMAEAARIIIEGAYETLAAVHRCTIDQVKQGLEAGHPRLCAQLVQLLERGTDEAVKLHQGGAISLVGDDMEDAMEAAGGCFTV